MNTKRIPPFQLVPGAILAVLTAATLYMSIRSSSHMSEIIWLPHWLGQWADQNPDLRTAVPFFLLSLLCPAAVGSREPSVKGRTQGREPRLNARWLIGGYAAIAVLLVSSECSQHFIQTRYLSAGDILWGFFGLGAGALAGLYAWWQTLKLTRLSGGSPLRYHRT